MDLIISVSGLRGIAGASLTPDVAARYVSAFAAELPPGPVVVSRDSRPSGPALATAIQAALVAAGRTVYDAGVASTPTCGVLVRQYAAAGGVQISASHNPVEYNGIKLFSAAGQVISAADGEQVRLCYERGPLAPGSKPGNVIPIADALESHLQRVLATVNVERIRARRFRVLLDVNHGAGGTLGRRLLDALGCEIIALGEAPDGAFSHPPEPTAENLAGVLARVVDARADVGFCQDPDADRLAIIDERGRYLGEEHTLALCVDHVLRGASAKGAVVTNCSTSRMSQELAEKHGVPFFRSAVGEANVVELIRTKNALIGGEGNGGVIDPRVGYVRDSFVGMALVLDQAAERNQSISTLAGALPRYWIEKRKINLAPARVPQALDALQQHFSAATADRLDGLRLDWPRRWLLVRASNTEPIVRAVAEAPTAPEAADLCQQAEQVLGSLALHRRGA